MTQRWVAVQMILKNHLRIVFQWVQSLKRRKCLCDILWDSSFRFLWHSCAHSYHLVSGFQQHFRNREKGRIAFFIFLSFKACVCGCVCAHVCGCQRTTCRSQFSSSTLWVQASNWGGQAFQQTLYSLSHLSNLPFSYSWQYHGHATSLSQKAAV